MRSTWNLMGRCGEIMGEKATWNLMFSSSASAPSGAKQTIDSRYPSVHSVGGAGPACVLLCGASTKGLHAVAHFSHSSVSAVQAAISQLAALHASSRCSGSTSSAYVLWTREGGQWMCRWEGEGGGSVFTPVEEEDEQLVGDVRGGDDGGDGLRHVADDEGDEHEAEGERAEEVAEEVAELVPPRRQQGRGRLRHARAPLQLGILRTRRWLRNHSRGTPSRTHHCGIQLKAYSAAHLP